MSARGLVVVGGGAGRPGAAARARRLCEQCGIIVFERGLPSPSPTADELPRDRAIIVHFASGHHSSLACRLLTQHGHKVRNLSGSWRVYHAAVTGGAARLPEISRGVSPSPRPS